MYLDVIYLMTKERTADDKNLIGIVLTIHCISLIDWEIQIIFADIEACKELWDN